MLRYIDHKKMGRGRHDWLDSHFHFSFAEYFDPSNIHFGVLRVLNDDLVKPQTGFGTHPHRDMEIISYVVDGELTHGDSMGNERTLTRGQAQYMSAGTGVTHSELNVGDKLLRFLQIWIMPDVEGHTPNYGDYQFKFEDRIGKWMPIAASASDLLSPAPIKIHQDVNIYATLAPKGESTQFEAEPGRQAYLVLIEGEIDVSGMPMGERDALEIIGERAVITPNTDAHMLVIEMARA